MGMANEAADLHAMLIVIRKQNGVEGVGNLCRSDEFGAPRRREADGALLDPKALQPHQEFRLWEIAVCQEKIDLIHRF
jgi:hypothetical protein